MNKSDKLALQRLVVGHFVEEIPEDCTKSVVYVMQGDGVYERRKNKIGTFITKIADAEIPGLDDMLENGWELAVPRIPVSLLGTAIAFFRKVYSMHHSEAFVQFFYDTDTKDYLLHCPKQTVSGASVKFERDAEFETPSRTLVMEIHSHGSMSAFFSGTDDKDEKDDRFYGVVGNVSDFFPQMKLRLRTGGFVQEVDIDDIFDIDEEMYHAETFPDEWPQRVEKKKEEKKGKRKEKDLVVYSGRHQHGRQAELFREEDAFGTPFGVADEDMNSLYEKYIGGDHLYSPHDFVKNEEEGEEYYIQKDGKLWHVTHGGTEETWVEVDKNKISQQLHKSFAEEDNDLSLTSTSMGSMWIAETADVEQDEMEDYNQRCQEWLEKIEKEDRIRKSIENNIEKMLADDEKQVGENQPTQMEHKRVQIPACDSPDFPPYWRDWRKCTF